MICNPSFSYQTENLPISAVFEMSISYCTFRSECSVLEFKNYTFIIPKHQIYGVFVQRLQQFYK